MQLFEALVTWPPPAATAGSPLTDWEHIALELAPAWLAALTAWQPYTAAEQRALGPRLLRGNLDIATEPADTFFDYDCSSCQVIHEIWSWVFYHHCLLFRTGSTAPCS